MKKTDLNSKISPDLVTKSELTTAADDDDNDDDELF